MSRAFKCDRCGKLYEMDAPEVGYTTQTYGFMLVEMLKPRYYDNSDPFYSAGGKQSTQAIETRYELCEDCYRDLRGFMEMEEK